MANLGAFAFIFDENKKILLCHRNDYDLWNFPGGTVEKGESPRETVIREVKEETGFDVEIVQLCGVYFKPEKDELVFQFECKIVSGELIMNEEANEFGYFDKENLPHNMSPKQVQRVFDYFSSEPKPIMKNQFGKGTIQMIKEGEL